MASKRQRSIGSASNTVGDPEFEAAHRMGARVSTKLKPDYVAIQRRRKDTRPPECLIAHYARGSAAGGQPRPALPALLRSLFGTVQQPAGPSAKAAVGSRTDRIAKQVRLLKPLMRRGDVYLEIGCGDALLPFALSGFAREVLGLDVTDALVDFAAAGQRRGTIRGPISDWRQGRQDGAACSDGQDPATGNRAAEKGRIPCVVGEWFKGPYRDFLQDLLMSETSSVAHAKRP